MSVVMERDQARVKFDAFDLESFRLFLRCKALPEKRLSYSLRTGGYELTTPARFAGLLDPQLERAPLAAVELAPHLFDYQRFIVERALEARRYAIWADTGLGKTAMFLEFARQVVKRTAGRVLILSPLAIIEQTRAEDRRFYRQEFHIERIDTRAQLAEWCTRPGPGIGITNYQKLIEGVLDELRHLAGLILDECFAPDTLIDTPAGPRRIRDLRPGDRILNAAGFDVVADVHRREVPYAIRIQVDGHSVVSSPNHPYFTQRGWVAARELQPGDRLVKTDQAVRLVRARFRGASAFGPKSLLREILLSEMADEATGDPREGSLAGGSGEARRQEERLAAGGFAGGAARARTNSGTQPDERPGDSSEGLPPIESDRPQTFRAWGQWSRADRAAALADGCTWQELESGMEFVTGPTSARLSDRLQAGSGTAEPANQHRGGWSLPSQPEGRGSYPRREAGLARVDSLAVLEPGHPDLAGIRDADGRLYFYDLGATRHPSYSVAGCLVHNSSILKTGGGVTKWNLIKSGRGIEYKLSCTATPAPNDTMEYASQAAFLEKLRNEGEILWTFFSRDKHGTWSVKPHARDAFFRFMASWSIYLRNPANYGWGDILASLPEPEYFEHRIPITEEQRRLMQALQVEAGTGMFGHERMGVRERAKFAQLARGFMYRPGSTPLRVEAGKPDYVAGLIAEAMPDPTLVWTTFDEEGELLAWRLRQHLTPRYKFAVLSGKTPEADRLEMIAGFQSGAIQVLVSKPQLLGYGLNFQNCRTMVFSGFDDSFERMYQAVRRAYRYGQTETVRVHLPFVAELEGVIFDNLRHKEARFMAEAAEQEAAYLQAMRTLGAIA